MKLLSDLPGILFKDHPDLAPTIVDGEAATANIRNQVHEITRELFKAYENEYTVFAPMSNCFELYGLDFMVDDKLGVHLLEANPGPDFKQTGDRLRRVIVELWEQTCAIVLDDKGEKMSEGESGFFPLIESTTNDRPSEHSSVPLCPHKNDFTLVYSKEWSSNRHKGGLGFN